MFRWKKNYLFLFIIKFNTCYYIQIFCANIFSLLTGYRSFDYHFCDQYEEETAVVNKLKVVKQKKVRKKKILFIFIHHEIDYMLLLGLFILCNYLNVNLFFLLNQKGKKN